MAITITPLNATFGASITAVALATLDDNDWQAIHSALLQYGVLVFPGQYLSEADQDHYAAHFGPAEQLSPRQRGASIAISNKKADGTTAQQDEYQYQILKGNEGWHTDSTYMPVASSVAMLTAIELPPEGGETEFADMRAAWDALDPKQQQRLESLSAYHSLYYSQAQAGFHHATDNAYGFHDQGAPLRPLIKTHPETGRKSIYTGRHAFGIPGLPRAASDTLLAELLHSACQPPRVYTHRWQVGDTVVWDNRCMMHRARPYNPAHVRILRGTRISGDPKTEAAPAFADEHADAYRPREQRS